MSQAGRDFLGRGLAVVGRAAFDDVADVHALARKADGAEHPRQKLSRRTHEGQALQILLLAGPFADEHQRRVRIALPHDLAAAPGRQAARLAALNIVAELLP